MNTSYIQHDLQIFRDNSQITGRKITQLQQQLIEITDKPNQKQPQLNQEVDKAKRLIDAYQGELEKKQHELEKTQKEHADVLDKVTRAREAYLKVETKLQNEHNKTHRDHERERDKLNNEIRIELRKQRAWETKATNMERDLRIAQKRAQHVANDNQVSHSRGAKRQFLR